VCVPYKYTKTPATAALRSTNRAEYNYTEQEQKRVKSEKVREGRRDDDDTMRTRTTCQNHTKEESVIPEEYGTNFNGDGGEHSPTEKRRVEAHRSSEETPK
jgi:hypothetical protein